MGLCQVHTHRAAEVGGRRRSRSRAHGETDEDYHALPQV